MTPGRHQLLILVLSISLAGCDKKSPSAPAAAAATAPTADPNVTSLFDGKSLGKWKKTEFGGEGEVEVENNEIIVHAGSTLSGVNYTGADLPTVDYEIEL